MPPFTMTNIQDVASFLGIPSFSKDDNKFFQHYFKSALSKKAAFSSKEQINIACELLHLPKDYQDIVQSKLEELNQDKELIFVANFLDYLLFHAKEPSENALYDTMQLSNFPSGALRILLLLNTLPNKHKDLLKRDVPKETYEHNFTSLSSNLQKNRQNMDVDNFRWATFQASLSLFKLGYLTFNLYVFHNYFKVYQNNFSKQVVLFAQNNMSIRQDGQINGVNDVWDDNPVTTILNIKNQQLTGHIIQSTGHIDLFATTISLQEYTEVIKQKDYLLEIHIPPIKGYTLENVYDSFMQAKEFFETYFKDYCVKGFWSLSWLYSPQLRELLSNKESNIIRIQDAVHLVPLKVSDATAYFFLFQKQTITPEEIQPTSLLLTRLKEYLLSGKRINCGGMLFLLDDLPKFLHQIYKK